ncbi:hypothetical protein IOD13_09315 [Brevibacterium casei]|nr:hypothetical protein [Brevibacterium casei]
MGSTTNLLETREGQFVAAGLSALVDENDGVALVELVTLMTDHGSHDSWFDEAVHISDPDERRAHVRTWWDDPSLARSPLCVRMPLSAPRWILPHEVIDALDLPQRIKAWSSPETRLGTLDALSQIAAEFDDAAQQTRSPSTPAGLLRHLAEAAHSTNNRPRKGLSSSPRCTSRRACNGRSSSPESRSPRRSIIVL